MNQAVNTVRQRLLALQDTGYLLQIWYIIKPVFYRIQEGEHLVAGQLP